MKNKVILTASDFWYLWNFRLRLINELTLKGWDVILVSSKVSGFVENDLALPGSVKFIDLGFRSHGVNLFSEGVVFLKLLCIFGWSRPSFILSFTPKMNFYSSLICLALRFRLIANVSGQGSLKNGKHFLIGAYRGLSRFLLSKAFYVFFQNDYDMLSMDLKGTNFSVLPGSGIDIDRFTYGYNESTKLEVFMACRLIREKGVEDFLACAAMFSGDNRIEFVLAGIADSSPRSVPESFIRDCCADVSNLSFIGAVDCIQHAAESCHVFILPSYYAEGTPKFLLEGLSMGKIIITTDTPGCRDTVCSNDNGFFVDAQAPQMIKDALSSILAMSNDQRVSMSVKSRELAVNRFDERFVLNRYFDILALRT
ncbi:glycosyltransferase [Porticoccaceae bacterium]|nr:glycosyltransferase [Porticoccaceae bacterium]